MQGTVEQLATLAKDLGKVIEGLTDLANTLAETAKAPLAPVDNHWPSGKTVRSPSQTMLWYSQHGSVLAAINKKGGTVSLGDFFRQVEEAGYTGGGYAQLYRKGGLLLRDEATRSMTITARGIKRLEYIEKYLADRNASLPVLTSAD